MATETQNETFKKEIIDRFLLDNAIEWISENLRPEEVFDEQVLEDYAVEKGFFPRASSPEDVFDEESLTKWALNKGFSRESYQA